MHAKIFKNLFIFAALQHHCIETLYAFDEFNKDSSIHAFALEESGKYQSPLAEDTKQDLASTSPSGKKNIKCEKASVVKSSGGATLEQEIEPRLSSVSEIANRLHAVTTCTRKFSNISPSFAYNVISELGPRLLEDIRNVQDVIASDKDMTISLKEIAQFCHSNQLPFNYEELKDYNPEALKKYALDSIIELRKRLNREVERENDRLGDGPYPKVSSTVKAFLLTALISGLIGVLGTMSVIRINDIHPCTLRFAGLYQIVRH